MNRLNIGREGPELGAPNQPEGPSCLKVSALNVVDLSASLEASHFWQEDAADDASAGTVWSTVALLLRGSQDRLRNDLNQSDCV